MSPAEKADDSGRITTELRAIRRPSGEWDVEESARGDDANTYVLIVAGPKRAFAPGLLTDEAFSAWIAAVRDEGFDVTITDIHGNPAHLDG